MQTIKNIQALRAIGASLIFTHHFGFQSYIVESFGDCGVCCFLMLSGFINYGVLQSNRLAYRASLLKETFYFLRKRVDSIMPLYYVGLVLALLIGERTYSFLSIPATTLMIQSWIPEQEVFFGPNAPSWFVSTLLFSLLLLPALQKIKKKIIHRILIVLILVYFFVLIIIPNEQQLYWIYIFPPMQFLSFIIGVSIWQLQLKWNVKISSKTSAASLQFISWCLMILLILLYRYVPYSLRLSSYWWIGTALLILALTITDSYPCFLTKVMHLPIIQKMGNASMSFYLLHIPWIISFRTLMQYLYNFHLIKEISKPIEFTLSLPLFWLICLAIHHYCYPSRK